MAIVLFVFIVFLFLYWWDDNALCIYVYKYRKVTRYLRFH